MVPYLFNAQRHIKGERMTNRTSLSVGRDDEDLA
jgi:hypothetical protein